MIKPNSPIDLAFTILTRSVCNVQVSCVLSDSHGIFSWGWNHSGATGFGEHAEHHAITRANQSRIKGSTATIIGKRLKSGAIVMSFPCDSCLKRLIKVGVKFVVFQDKASQFHKVMI